MGVRLEVLLPHFNLARARFAVDHQKEPHFLDAAANLEIQPVDVVVGSRVETDRALVLLLDTVLVLAGDTAGRPPATPRTLPRGPRTTRPGRPGAMTLRSVSTSMRFSDSIVPPATTTRP